MGRYPRGALVGRITSRNFSFMLNVLLLAQRTVLHSWSISRVFEINLVKLVETNIHDESSQDDILYLIEIY